MLPKLRIIYSVLFMCKVASLQNSVRNKLVSYSIPENREFKKSFGYYEDTYLNFTELASKYKYPYETYTVYTEDGYILPLFRLLAKCNDPVRKYPVILMHGIMDTADCWILTGPKLGIGFLLADNCYDVWAANHRGNSYARRHIKLNPDTDPEFWNFSFDENGYYDLTATIGFILEKTEKPKVNFIGHSQGTTDFFIMNSLRPQYNDKIAVSINLAPVTWLAHIESPLAIIAAQFSDSAKAFLEGAGLRELVPKDRIVHFLLELLCQKIPEELCGTGLAITLGYKPGTVRPRTLAIAFGHLFNGVSTKNAVHWGQLVQSKRFQRYDEGREGNIKRYGSVKPPQYNVSKVTAPVVLIGAHSDWISPLEDLETLSSKLPNLLEKYIVPEPYWSHHNHLWDDKAPIYVFPKILEYLKKYN
ncbi:hypothetical protein K1T71_003062 [Dendrolimus kikuchii]|uniref:Uncharacterized protein n=1 Tax=Dendrolimus kikuchii TaxID=765133 RepID=A0ACC1DAT0_9NEOP|nr:hypothetical protein K1T71_003062 [Dendrolimus kikuchii]